MLVITFGVILVTLVGQGLTLPWVVAALGWDGVEFDGDEMAVARAAAYEAGLEEIERARPRWPTHQPLFDRLEASLRDRCSTWRQRTRRRPRSDARSASSTRRSSAGSSTRSAWRSRSCAIVGEINDLTLREIERELDLEELRMEA